MKRRVFSSPMPRASVDGAEIARVEILFPTTGQPLVESRIHISARLLAGQEVSDGIARDSSLTSTSPAFKQALRVFLGACMAELNLPAGSDEDI